jgi:glycerate kinase
VRVLVAPDSFAGTLTAVEAAAAIAEGWRRGAPDVELDLAPLADGGPGFIDVLQTSLGGYIRTVDVRGPLGELVEAAWLQVGETGYIESSQACGLHLVPAAARNPVAASTFGVGQLMGAAAAGGSLRLVVGLGGSATTDGGRGMLEALGGRTGHERPHSLESVTEIVAATDVDSPLLGPTGAASVFGPQKGAGPETVGLLERRLTEWAAGFAPDLADRPGAGAAGGLGFALYALGGTRVSGLTLVADRVRLGERAAAAHLVVTGEGSFDGQSLRGKVCAGVAAAARSVGVPCLVLAGQVRVGRREAAAAGVEAAYAVADDLGSVSAAIEAGFEGLAALAARVARQWST